MENLIILSGIDILSHTLLKLFSENRAQTPEQDQPQAGTSQEGPSQAGPSQAGPSQKNDDPRVQFLRELQSKAADGPKAHTVTMRDLEIKQKNAQIAVGYYIREK